MFLVTAIAPSYRGSMLRSLLWVGAVGHRTAPGVLIASAVLTGGAQGQAPSRPALPGAPAGVTVFVGVNVVPMDTERVLENQTVLVEGGRITAMGPAGKIQAPASATEIDGRGKYLIPASPIVASDTMGEPGSVCSTKGRETKRSHSCWRSSCSSSWRPA
jgi:hypothetical protein